jgi:hypothetical protein
MLSHLQINTQRPRPPQTGSESFESSISYYQASSGTQIGEGVLAWPRRRGNQIRAGRGQIGQNLCYSPGESTSRRVR